MAADELVRALSSALPPGAVPSAACWQPLHRHVIESAPDDVQHHVAAEVSRQLGDREHVVVTLRAGDVDAAEAPDLAEVLRRTEGGVVIVGIGYSQGGAARGPRPSPCPECGSLEAEEIEPGPSDAAGPQSPSPGRLFECTSCGSVWDE